MTLNVISERQYKICSSCVMDTSDPGIYFDSDGVCNHCKNFYEVQQFLFYPHKGDHDLEKLITEMKRQGTGNKYDCILGLSGGVDSSYLALKLNEWGIRPLVVHVDAGWNTEVAISNIEKVVNYCNFDLYTHVVNWDEMRDLQVSYLKSGVSNQDVPQDHAFFASIYHFAIKNNIRFICSGGNLATESVFPEMWHHEAMDAINLHSIHKRFGMRKLRDYQTISFFQLYFLYPLIYKMRTVRPLNYIKYNKQIAVDELIKTIDWKPYGRKHGESTFTKFFQNYYLPEKFGIDKRRIHLSSLILNGELSRDEAISQLKEPLYLNTELDSDRIFFCKKLKITNSEFDELMNIPNMLYSEYRSWDNYYKFIKKMQHIFTLITGRKIKVYS